MTSSRLSLKKSDMRRLSRSRTTSSRKTKRMKGWQIADIMCRYMRLLSRRQLSWWGNIRSKRVWYKTWCTKIRNLSDRFKCIKTKSNTWSFNRWIRVKPLRWIRCSLKGTCRWTPAYMVRRTKSRTNQKCVQDLGNSDDQLCRRFQKLNLTDPQWRS